MRTVIIGCGDVGRCYAQALSEVDHQIDDIFDVAPTSEISEFARDISANFNHELGDWLGQADVVISAVYGGTALETFQKLSRFLKENALYIDLTTASVDCMQLAAARAKQKGIYFVDVALMGTVSIGGHRTPLFMAGEGAETAASIFRKIDAPVTVMNAPAGSAITLKLLRSVYTKGLEALAVECLLTAQQAGLVPDLIAALQDLDHIKNSELMQVMVQTHIRHASRRLLEVSQAKEQVNAFGVSSLVTDGIQKRFSKTKQGLDKKLIEGELSFEESLSWLITNESNV